MKKRLSYVLYLFLFVSMIGCNDNLSSSGPTDGRDTSRIIIACFEAEEIAREIADSNADTLYILKSNFFNSSWPTRIANRQIQYIEDVESARYKNKPGKGQPFDGRERFKIFELTIKNKNTAFVDLYWLNGLSDYQVDLKRKDGVWQVAKIQGGIE